MNLVAPKTTAEWRDIWLKKLEKACVEKGLKKPSIVGFLGQSTAKNCRFDGSVAVNFVSASRRQCGNFCMRRHVVVQCFNRKSLS